MREKESLGGEVRQPRDPPRKPRCNSIASPRFASRYFRNMVGPLARSNPQMKFGRHLCASRRRFRSVCCRIFFLKGEQREENTHSYLSRKSFSARSTIQQTMNKASQKPTQLALDRSTRGGINAVNSTLLSFLPVFVCGVSVR